MPNTRYLVLMDTDHIKEYIFATNRLKEIRGASLLLDRLNTKDCRDLLADFGGEAVFIGGGGVLATFPDKTQAEAYIQAVQTHYRQATHLVSISGVAVPILNDEGGEATALRRARANLQLAKGGRKPQASAQALLTSPYFRQCQSCNSYPVVTRQDGEEICAVCAAKRDEDKANTAFPDHSGYARFAKRTTDPRWANLTDLPLKIDHLEGPDTAHLGFIHADVNGLGAFLEQQQSLARIKEIGHQVQTALEQALVAAVQRVGLEPRSQTLWSFLIIILGGDDVTLIVPAKKAVPLANALCLAFEQTIKQALGESTNKQGQAVGQLALSAGVVIAKPKHPAHALADLAEDLTKNAKRYSHELETKQGYGPTPTLDFQVIHSPTANPLKIVRETEYTALRNGQEYWYTARPFPCNKLGAAPGVHTLLTAIKGLRRSGFPRNKLAAWADLIYTPEIEQILGWQILQTRLTAESKTALLNIIQAFDLSRERLFSQPEGTGHPYFTPLLDLIELYNFAEMPEQAHD